MAETSTILNDTGKELKRLLGLEKDYGKVLGDAAQELENALNTIKGFVAPFTMVQNAAIELAKSVGLAGKSIMATATRTIEQNRKMQLSMSYNMSSADMIRMQANLMTKLGRNVAIDQVGTVQRNAEGVVVNANYDSELENLIAAKKVFEGTSVVEDIVAGFDKVGKSMKSAAKATGKLYQEAGEYGINLQEYAEKFVGNLDMAQRFNFRNGVNGLKEMARKATEIRQDMKQIASFAEKVGSVTGAVETAANLQVLGGSFAALSNPLAMLNESLTNVEGLQDRFSKMTAGMARYDQTTHEIRMDATDRLRLQRAAEAMGVDASNLIDQAYAQARRGEIQRQMSAVGNLSPEMQKLLPNIGEIDTETGVAGATIQGQFRSLAEIAGNSELQRELVEETRSESDDIKVIAKSVMGIEDMVAGRKEQMVNEAARNKIIPGVAGGVSTYDTVLDTILDSFNDKAIEGVSKLDFAFNSLAETFQTRVLGGFAEFAKPFSADNPQDLGSLFSESFTNVFGDSPFAKSVGDKLGDIATYIATIGENINGYMSKHGYEPLRGFKETEYTGRQGAEALTKKDLPQNTSFAMAARDVSLQANNFTLNGTDTQRLEPIEQAGQLNSAAAKYANNDMYAAVVASLEDIKASFQVPIVTTPAETLKGVEITKTEASIPSITVSQPSQAQQTPTAGQQGATLSGTYNLNLSGNLTMDVRGDTGKIGSVDLLKMIQNDDGFRKELAKTLADAVARMNQTGLNKN